jgi:hypothetical protein
MTPGLLGDAEALAGFEAGAAEVVDGANAVDGVLNVAAGGVGRSDRPERVTTVSACTPSFLSSQVPIFWGKRLFVH